MKKRYKYTTAHQWNGDDGYQWSIFIKGQDKPVYGGLMKSQVPYYRELLEKQEENRKSKE